MNDDLRAAALELCEAVERECDATGPFGIVKATELLALCNAVRRAERAALAAEPTLDRETLARALVKRFQFDPQTSLGAADALIAEIQATREDRPS